jgi:predicted DNA-binding transcriptional regulator AlpA
MSSRVLAVGDQIDAIIRSAAREELLSALALLEGRRAVVRERLRVIHQLERPKGKDRALTAAQAARIAAGYSPSWFYEHASELEFTIRAPGRGVRFSESGLRSWVATWIRPRD